jgi:hypothetical protein
MYDQAITKPSKYSLIHISICKTDLNVVKFPKRVYQWKLKEINHAS